MVIDTEAVSDGRRLWQKRGVIAPRNPRKARPPLTQARLEELALTYVGRFATTRSKLSDYLARKLRERGWEGPSEPDPRAIAERLAARGYIDDAGYALSKAQALSARGYGKRRLVEKLRVSGVDEEDSAAAREHSDRESLAAALRFAQRRRIGPFADADPADARTRDKALGAMIRAGHAFALARAIVRLEPGKPVDMDALAESAGLTSR